MFPCLSSQNGGVKSANKKISLYATKNSWPREETSRFYEHYLDLIGEAARSCCVCIHTIEMVLFSATLDLVKSLDAGATYA